MRSLYQKLQQRNVIRVATAYALVSWLVAQAMDIVAEPLGLPDWLFAWILLALAIGFPLVLLIAWFLAPSASLNRAPSREDEAAPLSATARSLNVVIIAGLALSLSLSLAYFVYEARFADPAGVVRLPEPTPPRRASVRRYPGRRPRRCDGQIDRGVAI